MNPTREPKYIKDLTSTPNGKTISLYFHPDSTYFVRFKEGGELPVEFQGKFTDEAQAQHFINVYLSREYKINSSPEQAPFIPEMPIEGEVTTKKKISKLEQGLLKSTPAVKSGLIEGHVKLNLNDEEPELVSVDVNYGAK